MNDMKDKAEIGALIAFCALNPDRTEGEWVERNVKAIEAGEDDFELNIIDCKTCLNQDVLEEGDPRRAQVRDAMIYYQTASEIIDELAYDDSIIL